MPFPLQKPFSQLTYPWLTGWELISSGDLNDYPEFLWQLVLKKFHMLAYCSLTYGSVLFTSFLIALYMLQM